MPTVRKQVIKTIRLIAISYRGGPSPVFQFMFSLFSKNKDMNLGLMDAFLAILEPTAVGPVIYEGFIHGFMADFLDFMRFKMSSYNLEGSIKILQVILKCYPTIFDEFFLVYLGF